MGEEGVPDEEEGGLTDRLFWVEVDCGHCSFVSGKLSM